MRSTHWKAIGMVLCMAFSAFAAGSSRAQLAEAAAGKDAAAAQAAIVELRKMGASGLDALFEKYPAEIAAYSATGEGGDAWARIARALDDTAMQKDAYASRLYWYTDLDAAKAAAAAENKPILSLRLLGDLDKEFSCANSRLFRAILYPNAEVSAYLRANYILHWRSVRPAPRITIDFGDGRKIERTITGNSIHYILSSSGTVIDAIPGLYSPAAFLAYLKAGRDQFAALRGLDPPRTRIELMKWRKGRFDAIIARREDTIAKAGVQMTETRTGSLAILAAPMAVAKAVVVDEYSILRLYDDFAKFEASVKFDDWQKLAGLYAADTSLDARSLAFIRRQNAKTGLSEHELKQMLAKVESFVALDTTRNDFLFHTKIYEWLNQGRGEGDLEALNSRIYDQIFQTPDHDKWLGLYSNDVYTALDGNGIVK